LTYENEKLTKYFQNLTQYINLLYLTCVLFRCKCCMSSDIAVNNLKNLQRTNEEQKDF